MKTLCLLLFITLLSVSCEKDKKDWNITNNKTAKELKLKGKVKTYQDNNWYIEFDIDGNSTYSKYASSVNNGYYKPYFYQDLEIGVALLINESPQHNYDSVKVIDIPLKKVTVPLYAITKEYPAGFLYGIDTFINFFITPYPNSDIVGGTRFNTDGTVFKQFRHDYDSKGSITASYLKFPTDSEDEKVLYNTYAYDNRDNAIEISSYQKNPSTRQFEQWFYETRTITYWD